MYSLLEEVERKNFDAAELVEKLTLCTVSNNFTTKSDFVDFDPQILHDAFTDAIRQISDLEHAQIAKCEKLESELKENEMQTSQKIQQLIEKNKAEFDVLYQLNDKIGNVSSKVVHLGDRLESINKPRQRSAHALKLMHYMDAVMSPEDALDRLFEEEHLSIFETAEIIHNLETIINDLSTSKFETARRRVDRRREEIERALVDRFVHAHRTGDTDDMKQTVAALTNTGAYSQCVDVFIEHRLLVGFLGRDVFGDVIPLCEETETVIKRVFVKPSHVMSRFILVLFYGKLQDYIKEVLSDTSSLTTHLDNLCDMHTRTCALVERFSKFDIGHDNSFLTKIAAKLFQPYLDKYINMEISWLKQTHADYLDSYYRDKQHVKRQLYGGFVELKRGAAAVIRTKTPLHMVGSHVEDFGAETFLCEETVINMLQDSKRAFARCKQLSSAANMYSNAFQLYDLLLTSVMLEHVDYAIELALQVIPSGEPRAEPNFRFFHVIRQTNGIVHLMQKLYADSLLPIIVSTTYEPKCSQMTSTMFASLQSKLNQGLDKYLLVIIGWVRWLLQSEQKRCDFKPEADTLVMSTFTPACSKVVKFLSCVTDQVRDCFDGDNAQLVLCTLAEKLHRTLLDHIYQFQYNTNGAMTLVCDVNEYRRCVASFHVPAVNILYDTLHSLCNLLLVVPHNLENVISQIDSDLDRSVLNTFVQLRSDYKSSKWTDIFQTVHI